MLTKRASYNYAIKVLVILIVLVTIALHFILLIPGPDAGVFMYCGKLINSGKLPYINLWDNKPPIIYYIASAGYLYKNNPFLGARIVEAICYLADLYLIKKIAQVTDKEKSINYLFIFSICYLLFWEGGFLTEIFVLPLSLGVCYLYFANHKLFPQIAALLWWIIFLLKPNAVILPTILILIHLYKNEHKSKNTLQFLIPFFGSAAGIYIWLSYSGMWNGFVENVFLYNINYAQKGSYYQTLFKQLLTPSFVIYLIAIVTSLYYYSKNHSAKTTFFTFLAFVLCYVAAFVNGKNHEHYALLSILPAVFIIGDAVNTYRLSFIVTIILIVAVIHTNTLLLTKYYTALPSKSKLISTIKKHTRSNETIYYAGKHGAYLYILSNRFSSSKLITPFTEQHTQNSLYGQLITNELSNMQPYLLMIPKDSLASNSLYYTTIKSQLYYYTAVDTVENTVFYLLHAKQL